MRNPYLLRTAAVASLAAAVLATGWMGMQGGDEMQIAPQAVALSGSSVNPAVYFPAQFEIQPGADDGEYFEYH